jgi:hypothetical protein
MESVMTTRKRYRCRQCGFDFPATLPVTHEPDGAMLLHHLAAMQKGDRGDAAESALLLAAGWLALAGGGWPAPSPT